MRSSPLAAGSAVLALACALCLVGALVRCGGAPSTAALGDASVDGASDGAVAMRTDGGDAAAGCGLGCEASGGPVVFPPCPASPPAIDASCAASGEVCEYGPSWWLACNQVLRCAQGSWQHDPIWGNAPCGPLDAAACPATWAEATTIDAAFPACPALDCQYPEGYCECVSNCGSGGGQIRPLVSGAWSCQKATADCHAPRPRLGTACDSDAGCGYAYGPTVCGGCGQIQACAGGVWQGDVIPACE